MKSNGVSGTCVNVSLRPLQGHADALRGLLTPADGFDLAAMVDSRQSWSISSTPRTYVGLARECGFSSAGAATGGSSCAELGGALPENGFGA